MKAHFWSTVPKSLERKPRKFNQHQWNWTLQVLRTVERSRLPCQVLLDNGVNSFKKFLNSHKTAKKWRTHFFASLVVFLLLFNLLLVKCTSFDWKLAKTERGISESEGIDVVVSNDGFSYVAGTMEMFQLDTLMACVDNRQQNDLGKTYCWWLIIQGKLLLVKMVVCTWLEASEIQLQSVHNF